MHTTNHPPGYADPRYLDVAETFLRPIKHRSHELMRVSPGHTVLDLGCGVGLDTLALAERVGPSGHVYGIDRDEDMVAEANRRTRQAGLEKCVSHQPGEATELPFPDGFFDSCRTERMLMHVKDASAVIAEMVRLLKPGGWLVLVEPDWGTLSIASENPELERRLARVRAEQYLRNGYIGRQLFGLLRQANLRELSVEVSPVWSNDLNQVRYLTILDQVEAFALENSLAGGEEIDDWRTELQRAHGLGRFFASLGIMTVAGRKGVYDD